MADRQPRGCGRRGDEEGAAMEVGSEVPVAVLSSRRTLDLAISTWLPGFVARSSAELDVVLDLADEDGIIVIDLIDAAGSSRLEELRSRVVTAPVVAVLPAGWAGTGLDLEGLVIARSSQLEDLRAALDVARDQRRTSDDTPAPPPVVPADDAHPERWVSEEEAPVTETAEIVEAAGSVGLDQLPSSEQVAEPADAVVDLDIAEDAAVVDAEVDLEVAPVDVEVDVDPAPADAVVDVETVPAEVSVDLEPPEDATAAVPATPEPPSDDEGDGGSGDREVEIDLPAAEPTVRPGWWSRLRSWTLGPPVRTGNGSDAAPVHPVAAPDGPAVYERVTVLDAASAPDDEHLIDLAGSSELDAESAAALGATVELGATLRAWALLDELDRTIGAGSAVVAVRTSTDEYTIVAGVEIAAFEAEEVIPAGHPVLAELIDGPGWYLHTDARPELSAGLPLAACEELLVVAIPGTDRRLDGVLIVSHFQAFTVETAVEAARIAADVDQLHRRLAVRWAPAAPVDLAALAPAPSSGTGTDAEEPTGAVLSAPLVRTGWGLLDRLFPLLAGPSVVLTRSSTGVLVTTAAQHVDPDKTCQVVEADHPLLVRLAEEHGAVSVPATAASRELLRGLPVPRNAHLAAFAVGAAHAPSAVVLVSRQREVGAEEREEIVAAIATHVPEVGRLVV